MTSHVLYTTLHINITSHRSSSRGRARSQLDDPSARLVHDLDDEVRLRDEEARVQLVDTLADDQQPPASDIRAPEPRQQQQQQQGVEKQRVNYGVGHGSY